MNTINPNGLAAAMLNDHSALEIPLHGDEAKRRARAVGATKPPINREEQVRYALRQVIEQLTPWLQELTVLVLKAHPSID